MKAGQGGKWLLLAALWLPAVGCALPKQAKLERALAGNRGPATRSRDLESLYAVRCPDVLEVRVEGRPEACGPRTVGADGCIVLEPGRRLRIDGLPAPEIARAVARDLDLPGGAVGVQVKGYESQKIYLFGDAGELQQVVAYRGPERALELLQRVLGPNQGRRLAEVEVVRSHVADGKPPEVFTVDVSAILLKNDPQTNIRLEPFDRIHVAQSRPSRLAGCIPPWLTPLYSRVLGMKNRRADRPESR